MTSVCTFFINFQFNRHIIKELFKSDLMKFWKIVDGFLICCVNFVNRRKGLKQFKEVNKLLFRLVTALEILVTTSRHALYNILLSDRISSQNLFFLFIFNIPLERILLMWRHDLYRWGAAKLTRLIHSSYGPYTDRDFIVSILLRRWTSVSGSRLKERFCDVTFNERILY